MTVDSWLLIIGICLIAYFSIGGLLFERAWSRHSVKEVLLKGVLIWPWQVYLEVRRREGGEK